MTIVNDDSEVTRLEDFYARKRNLEAGAAAYSARAAARGTVIKRAGVAALLGGAGLGCAAFGASFLFALPKVDYRDIVVPRVTMRDVTADHVVPRDVPIDIPAPRIVPHDVPVDHVVVVPRDIEIPVPRIVEHPVDVEIPHIVQHDVPIEIPRVVTSPAPAASPPVASAPAPRSPQEDGFERSEGWRDAFVAGRIVRPLRNGFVLLTSAGEQSFFPARSGAGGAFEVDPTMREDVRALIGFLARCNRMADGTYACVALSQGRETPIPEIPITARPQGRPT